MRRRGFFLLIAIFLFTVSYTYAGEWVYFKSYKRSADFMLKGLLTKPVGSGQFPAIVMLHGAIGIEGLGKKTFEKWTQRFAEWGYVSLLVDSFGPRGKSNVQDHPLMVDPNERAQDAHDAKTYLIGLPFVKKDQVAVIGWSHGGWSVLRAIDDDIHTVNRGEPFKSAIAFYPYCDVDLGIFNSPLLVLTGELDDWCPAEMCKLPTEKTRFEVILKVYPEAYHGFDFEGIDTTVTARRHRLLYNAAAANDAIEQIRIFLAKYTK